MKDLGITRKELWGDCMPYSDGDGDNTIVYPSIELRPAQAKAAGLDGVAFGATMEITVKVRVSSVSQNDEGGANIRLDVLAMDGGEAETGLAGRYAKAASK